MMNQVFAAASAGLLLLLGPPAQAQCLPLTQLLVLAHQSAAVTQMVVTGAAPHSLLQRILPADEWAYQGPVGSTRDYYWTNLEPGARAGQRPTSWLSLRPAQATHDVVLKTTAGGCIRQLRRELEQQQLHPEAVTCLDCEGVRYQAPAYNVTIYSGRPGDYPFVLVLRQLPAPAAEAQPAAVRQP